MASSSRSRRRPEPSTSRASPCSPWSKLDGYELIIGSSLDSQFGPVLLFGTGGQLVEVFKDRALALPPLNSTLARRLMEQTKIFTALKGVRGRKPVDLKALEELLVRFSQLVVEQPWIKEIDINPLLASPDRLLALDARVVVHGPEMKEERPAGAAPSARIPIQLVNEWTMKDGNKVTIRPIRPEDEPADDRVPREAVGAQRVPALLPAAEADAAHRARAADAHLLHRLRPRDGAGGRAQNRSRRAGDCSPWAA